MRHALLTSAAFVGLFVATPAYAGDIVLFDQIGDAPFTATALSSSQFQPGSPETAFTTVDNVVLDSIESGGPLRITRIEAAVAGLQNFNGFELVDSWTVQIYSSLEASIESLEGDIFSATFDFPDELTTGFGSFFGDPVELASFDVDFVVEPGEYWMTVAMGNDNDLNGIVGIAGSAIGDGPAYFSGPGAGDVFSLSNPAAYRVIGGPVPAPGAGVLLGAALLGLGRSRRRLIDGR